jgi:ketosteroid isomerase-like protein
MSDIAKLDQQLNHMILTGQALDAFEQFYADDVVMQEPNAVREGKEENRQYEQQFFSSIEEFHRGELLSAAVGDDTSFSEWVMEVTFKGGNRVRMEQAARRTWKDGKVVHERFYYNA